MYDIISIGSLKTTTYKYKKHSHQYWEVTYYYDGNGVNIANGTQYPFTDGTILCIPPHMQHEDRSEYGYKNIFFMVETFNFPSNVPVLLHDNADKDFLYILKQLYKEYYTEKSTKNKIINALLNVLYSYIVDFLGSKSSNMYVDFLRRAIIENISNPNFSVSSVMKDIPINPDYFRRLFKTTMGIPPLEYLQSLRIANAKQMLANSSFPLKDICEMCGYQDPYYFSRLFKKEVHISPSDYRKKFFRDQ